MNMNDWIIVACMILVGGYTHTLIGQVSTLKEQLQNAAEMIGDMAKALKNTGYKNVEYHG